MAGCHGFVVSSLMTFRTCTESILPRQDPFWRKGGVGRQRRPFSVSRAASMAVKGVSHAENRRPALPIVDGGHGAIAAHVLFLSDPATFAATVDGFAGNRCCLRAHRVKVKPSHPHMSRLFCCTPKKNSSLSTLSGENETIWTSGSLYEMDAPSR